MGIASLILGIIAILTAFTIILAPLGIILSLIGLILGIVDKSKKNNMGEKKGITIAGIIICSIMLAILTLESLLLGIGYLAYKDDTNYTPSIDIEQNKDIESSDNTNEVLGTYSREIFSGNSFAYKTMYDNATFKFNKDSTFECSYEDGLTYKGIYEVYNGFYITTKASEISKDTSIKYAESLAENITNVSTQMMDDTSSIVNTYLLYLKVTEVVENGISKNQEVLQPFVLKYDPNTNIGRSVNIYGQTSGTFTLK